MDHFRKNGFDYRLVERRGNTAIYRQMKGNTVYSFEVGRIRESRSKEQFGVVIEAAESWPSSEEWGIRAWTYKDLRRARERLDTLTPPNATNLTPAQE